ncbi:MAG: hypothetical protein EZS28_000138 [Streblomastix strix]|uniref:Uncharacterized protein n=1 Tax=Streblomastix strix TaxID=222440 RepID=A0A5J4XCU4_9EUKA|nr:MAG: hypothetical protein EZS28_000138 [Streblomastix strix]
MTVVGLQEQLNYSKGHEQQFNQRDDSKDVMEQGTNDLFAQNPGDARHDWLKPFTNNRLTPMEESRTLEILELGQAVFEGQYWRKLKDQDQTSEHAQLEVRHDIKRRETMILLLLHEDTQVPEQV